VSVFRCRACVGHGMASPAARGSWRPMLGGGPWSSSCSGPAPCTSTGRLASTDCFCSPTTMRATARTSGLWASHYVCSPEAAETRPLQGPAVTGIYIVRPDGNPHSTTLSIAAGFTG
jgi:hypothetical protein